jgi:hypothetical protein
MATILIVFKHSENTAGLCNLRTSRLANATPAHNQIYAKLRACAFVGGHW